MDKKNKYFIIMGIPFLIVVIISWIITDNLFYHALAGAIGIIIGLLFLKLIKKYNLNKKWKKLIKD